MIGLEESTGHNHNREITIEQVTDACHVLIQHTIQANSDDTSIVVQNAKGQQVIIRIKFIDADERVDKPDSST